VVLADSRIVMASERDHLDLFLSAARWQRQIGVVQAD